MKVSVIIPVFNTFPGELECCLKSVAEQDIDSFEVIIVDDGSVDNEERARILAEFNDGTKFRLLTHAENRGLTVARNTGLDAARGDYIVHLDSDDFWLSNSVLSTLYNIAIIDGCEILRFNGQYFFDGKLGSNLMSQELLINKALSEELCLMEFRSIFLFFFKRTFILSNNLYFSPLISIGEDAVYVSSALSQSKCISTVNESFYAYRIDNLSMMRSVWGLEQFKDENNSAREVIYNLREHKNVLKHYVIYRYEIYFFNAILPRCVLYLQEQDFFTVLKEHEYTLGEADKYLGYALETSFNFRLFRSFLQIHNLRRLSYILYFPLKVFHPILVKLIKMRSIKPALKRGIKRVIQKVSLGWHFRFVFSSRNRREINSDGFKDHTIESTPRSRLKIGLSVLLRVKDEEQNIRQSISSIISSANEIAVIDNGSRDGTVAVVQAMIDSHPEGNKIRLYSYPFNVARCGAEHNSTPEDSVNNLAYYYNWCLSKCRFNTIIKWDADMVFINEDETRKLFDAQVKRACNSPYLTGVYLSSQTIYLLNENDGYKSQLEVNGEIRIFSNSKYVMFTKGIDFEVLTFMRPFKVRRLSIPIAYEIKRLSHDEFSHWGKMSFSKPRKVQEYRNFVGLRDDLLRPDQYKHFPRITLEEI
ncbi:MAG: glycosyltransferase involved in cell wall biosynthesis [Enterobacterales bacterium]|jgi:glycosyltransferase involved in cell wall biosynthesis